jgi:predicted nuclease of predicted toxin-antitoxin system
VRIKLDENLPFRLVRILAPLGHETDTVPQKGLAGQDDAHVWQAAQTVGRFFITQDLDFSDTCLPAGRSRLPTPFCPGAHGIGQDNPMNALHTLAAGAR